LDITFIKIVKKILKRSCTFGKLKYICQVNEKQTCRTVIFYKSYFHDFFSKLQGKVQEKIFWTIDLIEELEIIPEIYLKHIKSTDGLYEVRVNQGSNIFRIFAFFDEGKLIILANGFQKKTNKIPKKEIEKALKIKAEYEEEKFK